MWKRAQNLVPGMSRNLQVLKLETASFLRFFHIQPLVSSAANLTSNYILKLHPLFIPIIRALHHLFSPSCNSPTLFILWPRFQTHESGMCIPAPWSPPLTPSPTFKSDDPGFHSGSAVTCCMASPVATLPHPLCSPLCQVPRVGEHAGSFRPPCLFIPPFVHNVHKLLAHLQH